MPLGKNLGLLALVTALGFGIIACGESGGGSPVAHPDPDTGTGSDTGTGIDTNTATVSGIVDTSALAKPLVVRGTHFNYSPAGAGLAVKAYDKNGLEAGNTKTNAAGDYSLSLPKNAVYIIRIISGGVVMKAVVNLGTAATSANVNPHSTAIVLALGKKLGVANFGESGVGFSTQIASINVDQEITTITGNANFNSLVANTWLSITAGNNPFSDPVIAATTNLVVPGTGTETGSGAGTGTGTGTGSDSGIAYVPPPYVPPPYVPPPQSTGTGTGSSIGGSTTMQDHGATVQSVVGAMNTAPAAFPAPAPGSTATNALHLADKISVVSSGTAHAPKVTGFIRALFAPKSVTVNVPANSDYYTDPQFVYVRDRAAEQLNKPNEILCMIAQSQYGQMINQGPYKAQIDEKQCKSKSAKTDSSQATNNQASSNVPAYQTWTVNSIRGDNISPQVIEAWVHSDDVGGRAAATPGVILIKVVITEGVATDNPYGLFVVNYRAFPLLANGAANINPNDEIMHGFLRSGVQNGTVVLEMANERADSLFDATATVGVNGAYKPEINNKRSRAAGIRPLVAKKTRPNAKHLPSNFAKGFRPHIEPVPPSFATGVNPNGKRARNAGAPRVIAPRSANVPGTRRELMVLEKNPVTGAGSGQVERVFTRANGTHVFEEAFRFAYNSHYFKRENLNAIGNVVPINATAATAGTPASICMDVNSKNTYAWRYGLYDAGSGSRVDINSGFPIRYVTGGVNYDGYAGIWGLNLRLPAGVGVASGALVHKFDYATGAPDAATPYYYYKSGGKLTKHTKKNVTLTSIKNVPMQYSSTDNDPASTTHGQWLQFEVAWDGAKLAVTKYLDQATWYWRDYTGASTDVSVNTWDSSFNFWSDTLGGSGQINLPRCDQADVDSVTADVANGTTLAAALNNCLAPGNVRGRFNTATQTITPIFSGDDKAVFNTQTTVMPGENVPAALACFENCPNGGTMQSAGLNPNDTTTYQHAAYTDTNLGVWDPANPNIGQVNNTLTPATVANCQGKTTHNAAVCTSAASPNYSAPSCVDWTAYAPPATANGLMVDTTASLTGGVITTPPVIVSGGAGYAVGDAIWVSGGNGDAILQVAALGAGSDVATVNVINGGTGYAAVVAWTQITAGAGLTVDTTASLTGNVITAPPVIVSGGTGYRVGDLIKVSGGMGDAVLQVAALDPAGTGVLTLSVYRGGAGYAATASVATATITAGPGSTATAGSGVTVDTTASITGNVITTPPVIVSGGAGYAIGDLLWVSGGNGDAILRVATLGVATAVATVTIFNGGTGYNAPGIVGTIPPIPGVNCGGSALTLNQWGSSDHVYPLLPGSPGGYYGYTFNNGAYTLTDNLAVQPATLGTSNIADASWGFNSGLLFDSTLLEDTTSTAYTWFDWNTGAPTPGQSFQKAITCDYPYDWQNVTWDINGVPNYSAAHFGTCTWRLMEVLNTFYTWETGPNDWNTFQALATTATPATPADFVFFDQPWSVSYTHSEAGSPFDGSTNLLQYNGYGDLWGIPGKCVSFDTGAEANCDQNSMWAPAFTIPDGAAATASYLAHDYTTAAKSVIVKALEKEETLLPAASLSLCPDTKAYLMPGIASWVDPIDPLQGGIGADHAGTEPVAAIKVIGGVVKDTTVAAKPQLLAGRKKKQPSL